MNSKSLYWILLFFLSLSCFLAQTHGKKERHSLDYLYKAGLKQNFGVDTSLFKVIDHVNEANVHPQVGLKQEDRIERLPGQPHVNFSQYGGYVTVDKSAGRALYYYFVEAYHSKNSLPLLLWLNGGTWSISCLQVNVTSTISVLFPCLFLFSSYFFPSIESGSDSIYG